MGNVCPDNFKNELKEADTSKKVDKVREKRIVLSFLLEKMHSLKTEESKKKINFQIKETFEEYENESELVISRESLFDQDKFLKALEHYSRLFSQLKIDTLGLCWNITHLQYDVTFKDMLSWL